jgi:hypothetical protein
MLPYGMSFYHPYFRPQFTKFGCPRNNGSSELMKRLTFITICLIVWSLSLPAQQILDSVRTWFYSTETDSFCYYKLAYEYDAAGEMISKTRYQWDSGHKAWTGTMFPAEECLICTGRLEYSRDPQAKKFITNGFYWRGLPYGWVNGIRTTNTFDASGNTVRETHEGENGFTHSWDTLFALDYEYNGSGQRTSSSFYRWDSSSRKWLPQEKQTFAYDSLKRLTEQIRYSWDATIPDWSLLDKKEWYFDPIGFATGSATFSWSWIRNRYDWLETDRQKIEYIPDSAGNYLSTMWYRTEGSGWTFLKKEERTFDESGKVLSLIESRYDSYTRKWNIEMQWVWTYLDNGRKASEMQVGYQYVLQGLPEFAKVVRQFNPAGDVTCATWYTRNYPATEVSLSHKDYYHYRTISAGIGDTPVIPILVYPNPTGGILQITGLTAPATVKVYSIQGQLLLTIEKVTGTADITPLAAGSYIIQVLDCGARATRRIILKDS